MGRGPGLGREVRSWKWKLIGNQSQTKAQHGQSTSWEPRRKTVWQLQGWKTQVSMGISRKLKGEQVLRATVPEMMKDTWCSALGLGRLSPTGRTGAHSQRPTTQVCHSAGGERKHRPAAAQFPASQRKQTPASLSRGFSVVFYCWQQMHILEKKAKTMWRAISPFWCRLQNWSASYTWTV